MNTMTKATQEKKFSPHNSLSNYQHHLKISLAEDYWFSLFSASGFVLRLQLSRGRTPCPDSAWLWFISSSNMPAWLPGLIKGQDNSNSNRSRRVERPCLLCETEHLEIFKRQIREQSSPGHHSAWQWQRRQPHRSLGPLPSRGGNVGGRRPLSTGAWEGMSQNFWKRESEGGLKTVSPVPASRWRLGVFDQMYWPPQPPTQVVGTGWVWSSRLGRLGVGCKTAWGHERERGVHNKQKVVVVLPKGYLGVDIQSPRSSVSPPYCYSLFSPQQSLSKVLSNFSPHHFLLFLILGQHHNSPNKSSLL